MVHSNTAFLKDLDRKVKVYLNGTAVSNSPLQSVYAKYLNFVGNYTVVSNNSLGTYDISFTDDGKIIIKLNGANVGTGASLFPNFINDFNAVANGANYDISLKYPDRIIPKLNNTAVGSVPHYANFSTDFNVTENIGNDTDDISLKYPGHVLSNVNTIPRKLNFVDGITAKENVSNDTIDISAVSPVSAKKWGLFSGGSNSVSGTSTLGSGFMSGWKTSGTMASNADINGSNMTFTTSTTANNAVYHTGDSNTGYIYPGHNPTFWVKFVLPDITNVDMYIGFFDFPPPLPTTSFDYLKGSHRGFGLTFDSGSWTTYQLMWNNQASASSILDTTVTVTNNAVVTAKIFCDFANSRWGVSVNGGTPLYVPSTDTNFPPITGWTYGFITHFQNTSGVSRLFNCYYLFGQTDL